MTPRIRNLSLRADDGSLRYLGNSPDKPAALRHRAQLAAEMHVSRADICITRAPRLRSVLVEPTFEEIAADKRRDDV